MRAMVELAKVWPDGSLSVKETAARQRLSTKYLEQIVIPLRSAGLIKAVRGVHGGYALTRSPREIPIAEVFAALEGPPAIVECLKASVGCAMQDICPTQGVWRKMNDAISSILDATTLAELAGLTKGKRGAKRRTA